MKLHPSLTPITGLILALMVSACGRASGLTRSPTATLTIKDAWVRYSPAASPMGAAYFVISNTGNADDQLLAVTTEAAQTAEMHRSDDMEGLMSMSPVGSVTIPAGGQTEFKPGGYHVMLMNLTRPLNPGDTVKLTFTFQQAGQISIACEVRDH